MRFCNFCHDIGKNASEKLFMRVSGEPKNFPKKLDYCFLVCMGVCRLLILELKMIFFTSNSMRLAVVIISEPVV